MGRSIDMEISGAAMLLMVMSVSDKPRLADRQPSSRGGVLRVTTWLRSVQTAASADSPES